MVMSQTARPSTVAQPFGPRQSPDTNFPPEHWILVLASTHAVAPSSSPEHGSPAWLPVMSHDTPFGVRPQPRGPLQGAKTNFPFEHTSCVVLLTQRPSPRSHELPGPGLQPTTAKARSAAHENPM